jgi:hypothetical protein
MGYGLKNRRFGVRIPDQEEIFLHRVHTGSWTLLSRLPNKLLRSLPRKAKRSGNDAKLPSPSRDSFVEYRSWNIWENGFYESAHQPCLSNPRSWQTGVQICPLRDCHSSTPIQKNLCHMCSNNAHRWTQVVMDWLNGLAADFYDEGIVKLVQSLNKCLNRNGNYISCIQ